MQPDVVSAGFPIRVNPLTVFFVWVRGCIKIGATVSRWLLLRDIELI